MGNLQDGLEWERGQLCTALQCVLHVRSPPFPLQGHCWPTTGTLPLEAHDSVLQYDFLVRKIGVRVQPSCAFLVTQAPAGCSELPSACPPTSPVPGSHRPPECLSWLLPCSQRTETSTSGATRQLTPAMHTDWMTLHSLGRTCRQGGQQDWRKEKLGCLESLQRLQAAPQEALALRQHCRVVPEQGKVQNVCTLAMTTHQNGGHSHHQEGPFSSEQFFKMGAHGCDP